VQPRFALRAFPFHTVFYSALLLLHGSSYAQVSSPSSPETPPTIRVSSQFVMLDALIENKQAVSFPGNLQLNDFRLSEDGVPQKITYFSQDRLPLSVVFLFDLTETVRSALKPLAEGANEILGHLKPEDEVAVMVFSSHTELLQKFTTDRALASDAIAKASAMESKDGTFIHESMFEAVNQATQATVPDSRRVMIWLTDGTANFENSMTMKTIGKGAPARLHTREEATAALLHSGVVVSALIDRTAATDITLVAMNANPLAMMFGGRTGDIRKYAELTGGPVLDTSKKEIADRLAQLVDHLKEPSASFSFSSLLKRSRHTLNSVSSDCAPGMATSAKRTPTKQEALKYYLARLSNSSEERNDTDHVAWTCRF
jgi:VWFA-related protein